MNKKIIVVTGAAGMIGSGVVKCLNDRGHQRLLLVDDLKQSDKWKNLVGKKFIDLVSKNKIYEALQEHESMIEAILHLGACSDTVQTDCDYLLENNFRYTIRLAEWALQRDLRFIYASSAATYGDGSRGFCDDEDALEELRPLNMYGYSKHLVDLWMKRQGVLKQVVGLKYFNVFGPNEYHKGRMASMVLKMTHIAKKDGVIQLYKSNDANIADGEQCRDFIYVKDAVVNTCDFLRPEHRKVGGIFNIGRGQTTTWNELAQALFLALDKPSCIHYVDMPSDINLQYQNYTCADMGKLHKIFSAKSASVKDAVCEYVREYLLRQQRW
jgi:ADP-L-glycero-D-manno-heptose 6-epimerase